MGRRTVEKRNIKYVDMWNSYFCDINFLALGCFIYKPPICCSPPPPPLQEQFRKKRAINDDIYEKEFSFSIKISIEGLMSLVFVQLPGISLGLLGILKAFMNHGLSKDAAVDSLRYINEKMLNFASSILNQILIQVLHSVLSSLLHC